MAENTRLILKAEANELFTDQNYKIHPELLENPLWSSLNTQPSYTDIFHPTPNMQTLAQRVIGIYYDGVNKTVSAHNNQASFDTINTLRNQNIPSYTNIRLAEDSTLEYIPEHPHILEQIENLERMATEYSSKLNSLEYLVGNLFDISYAVNMYMVGRKTSVVPNNGRLYSPYDGVTGTRISGYIKVENANPSITMNMVIRGIPVSMRKTLTSINNDGRRNYIFTYPQYLMNNVDIIQAIQYIEVKNQGSVATFWYGNNYNFQMDLTGFDNKLNNIHIINKNSRNLVSDSEHD